VSFLALKKVWDRWR